MKRILIIATLGLLLAGCGKIEEAISPPVETVAVLTAEEQAFVRERVITVGIEATYPPFISWEKGKPEPVGLSYEFLQLVQKKTGLKFELKNHDSLDVLLKDFKAKKLMMVTSLKPTPDRMAFMSFTNPYVSVGTVMLLKGKKIDFPVTVAYSKRYAVQEFIEPLAHQVTLVPFNNDTESFDAFVSGKVGSVVLDVASAKIQEDRVGEHFNRAHVSFTYELAFAYQKDEAMLGRILDKGLAAITEAEAQTIRAKYFGRNAKVVKPIF